jgi:hypothetical protein
MSTLASLVPTLILCCSCAPIENACGYPGVYLISDPPVRLTSAEIDTNIVGFEFIWGFQGSFIAPTTSNYTFTFFAEPYSGDWQPLVQLHLGGSFLPSQPGSISETTFIRKDFRVPFIAELDPLEQSADNIRLRLEVEGVGDGPVILTDDYAETCVQAGCRDISYRMLDDCGPPATQPPASRNRPILLHRQ